MKFSKIIATFLLACSLFSLASCNRSHSQNHNQQNQNTGNPEEDKITYIYSVTQEVLHLSDCYHVEFMNPKYRVTYTGEVADWLSQGLSVCKDCLAKESESNQETTREPDPDEVSEEEATYVVNRSSLTIHVKGCYNIDKMTEKNVKYTCLSYEELIENDHIPCGFCMPDEYKAYKEANPDKFKDEN